MKISIYVLSLNYGGAEKVITNIANILSEDNEVTINSIYKLNDKPFFKLNSNIKVNYLTECKPNKKEFMDFIQKKQLIKAFKEGLKSLKILYYKKKTIIKHLKKETNDIVITTRKEHNYYSGKYAPQNIIKIGQEHNDFYKKKDIKKVCKGAKKLDYFMPTSKFLKDKYQILLEKYPVQIKYIPNNIDEYKLKNIKKHNQLIAVGRLEKIKGFSDLIDVFEIVHKENKEVKLIIVGSGSEEQNLKQRVASKNLTESIIFKGIMNSKELELEYEKSKALVCTSYSESFGLVALEAANAKTPTIAFDSAKGFKEIIRNSGILVANRNKEKMAKVIIDLLNDPLKCEQLGLEAKSIASSYYTECISDKWHKFIKNLK